jgi:hypothetical protein
MRKGAAESFTVTPSSASVLPAPLRMSLISNAVGSPMAFFVVDCPYYIIGATKLQ